MMNFKKISGFALLEVMIATILLCGLIYMFISFTQTQQRQVNTQSVGKQLAIVVNSVIKQVSGTSSGAVHPGQCVNGGVRDVHLKDCIAISPNFQATLKSQGLDPATATVDIN